MHSMNYVQGDYKALGETWLWIIYLYNNVYVILSPTYTICIKEYIFEIQYYIEMHAQLLD